MICSSRDTKVDVNIIGFATVLVIDVDGVLACYIPDTSVATTLAFACFRS